MSKSRKPVNKKKVLKIVLISLAVFIVLNLIGAAVGTSTLRTPGATLTTQSNRR